MLTKEVGLSMQIQQNSIRLKLKAYDFRASGNWLFFVREFVKIRKI